MKYLLWLCLLLPLPATSGTLLTGFVTHHFGGSNWCENNYGIGYRTDNNWAFGYYKNSDCRSSFYAAKELKYNSTARVTPGILLGAVSGYNLPVTPVVLPELVFQYRPLELALVANPLKLKGLVPFVALQARWRF